MTDSAQTASAVLFCYAGVRCECRALFVTAVDRCSQCGRWDPLPADIDAAGTLVAATSTTGVDGQTRTFGMVDLACGLRVIGLTAGDPALGAPVVAWTAESGVPIFEAAP